MSDVAEGEGGGADDASVPVAESPAPPSATVGTGSTLAVGCIVAVVVLVLLAIAARWLTGAW